MICSPGTYDQKHIDRIGHLRDCIAYGPGILDLAHQPDEYVEMADMTASAKVMALAGLRAADGGRGAGLPGTGWRIGVLVLFLSILNPATLGGLGCRRATLAHCRR